jgi:diguanylate cyclase (GGDEF)-like protein
MHDPLTDLPNRITFEEQLKRARAEAEEQERKIAVMFLDLDRFKAVNDTYGHDCGDRLLVEVGRRLQGCVRKSDLVARFGGDEFALLAPDYQGLADITHLAERIIKAIAEPMEIDGHRIEIGVSIGITVFPDDPSPAGTLVANADLALYQAKKAGRGTWRRYHPNMPTRRKRRQVDDRAIREALKQGQFELRFQPIVRISDLAVIGIEAELNWDHPRRDQRAMTSFLQDIAGSKEMPAVTEWILAHAVPPLASWQALASEAALAVNLPAQALAIPIGCRYDGKTRAFQNRLHSPEIDRVIVNNQDFTCLCHRLSPFLKLIWIFPDQRQGEAKFVEPDCPLGRLRLKHIPDKPEITLGSNK